MPPDKRIALSSAVSGRFSIRPILDSFSIEASFSSFAREYPHWDMSIHKLIREGRERLQLTEEAFGTLCGVSRAAVQHWEREGGTAPNRTRQPLVAKALGISVAELLSGGAPNVSEVETGGSFPLISWVDAGKLNDVEDPFHPGDSEHRVTALQSKPGKSAFALRVNGDSMTSPDPEAKYSFPDGTIIFVDPDRGVDPGAFVVAKDVQTQQATFKRLAYDGGRWYLKPLNPQYKTIEIDDPSLRIIGRVIEFQTVGKL
jgi:SOS-response transcriptional repressor LexA